MPPWATRQVAALVAQFVASDASAWIGAKGRENIERGLNIYFLRSPKPAGQSWIEPAPGVAAGRGFVLVRPGSPNDPELWLDPTLGNYRALFKQFAKAQLGAAEVAADLQIDHVFPKTAGSLNGLGFVRMLAIPAASNMSAGRTVERHMALLARDVPGRKGLRHATYVSIGKAVGFAGWQQLPDSEDAAANDGAVVELFGHLRRFGIGQDVLSMLDRRLAADRLRTLR